MSKYKSKFEQNVATVKKLGNSYEIDRIKFIQPVKNRTYIPDFTLKTGIYLECKGRFTAHDRFKMLWLKQQYPEYIFLLLFQNSSVRITKTSKTTYAMWAEKNGFDYGDWRQGWPKRWNKYLK